MKKLLAIVLSLTLTLAMSATAFAATEVTVDENAPTRGESTDRAHSIEGLFTEYYQEGLASHEALQAEHQAFHSSRQALREASLAEHDIAKADMKAQFEAIRTDYEAGTITQEEARALIAPLKEDITSKRLAIENFKADLKIILAEKQAANEVLAAQREGNRAIIMTALQSDPVDAAAIATALATGLDLLRQHIDLDYYYAGQVDALLANN